MYHSLIINNKIQNITMTDTIKRTIKPVVETQFIGLTRVVLGLPIEHFFDRFKTII